MEKWNTSFFKNKAGSNAVTTHSDMKNIPRALSFANTLCITLILLTNEPNRADCGYQIHGTETRIRNLLYMDD